MWVTLPVEVVVVGNAKQIHQVKGVVREVLKVGVEVVVQFTWATKVKYWTEVLVKFTARRRRGGVREITVSGGKRDGVTRVGRGGRGGSG